MAVSASFAYIFLQKSFPALSTVLAKAKVHRQPKLLQARFLTHLLTILETDIPVTVGNRPQVIQLLHRLAAHPTGAADHHRRLGAYIKEKALLSTTSGPAPLRMREALAVAQLCVACDVVDDLASAAPNVLERCLMHVLRSRHSLGPSHLATMKQIGTALRMEHPRFLANRPELAAGLQDV